MCKLFEDMRNEAAILAYIEAARHYGASDEVILADIIKKYNLTEEQAKDYSA